MTFNKMIYLVNHTDRNGVGAVFYYRDGSKVHHFYEDQQSAGLGIDRASATFKALHDAGKVSKVVYYWKRHNGPAMIGDFVKVHFYHWIDGRETHTHQNDKIYKVYQKDGNAGIDYAGEFTPLTGFSTRNGAVAFEII